MVVEKFDGGDISSVKSQNGTSSELGRVLESDVANIKNFKYEDFCMFIKSNWREIRGLSIDNEKKEIDLRDIGNPKNYKISIMGATTFFKSFYYSNLALFGEIEGIGKKKILNTTNLKELLQKFFEKEYEGYTLLLEIYLETYEDYKNYLKNNITNIRGLSVNEKMKVIDLSDIGSLQTYKIANMLAVTFLYKLIKSNPVIFRDFDEVKFVRAHNSISIPEVKKILKFFFEKEYVGYNIVGDLYLETYDDFRSYLKVNITEIRGVEVNEEKKEIDIANIEYVKNIGYNIANMKANTFFLRMYKSNGALFGEIEGVANRDHMSIKKIKEILKIFFEEEYNGYDIILEYNYEEYKKYIKENIKDIKGLYINENTNEIDLTNIERPLKKGYKIAKLGAGTFFLRFYKSNPTLFGQIESIERSNQIHLLDLKEILKKFLEEEYKCYQLKMEKSFEDYKKYIEKNQQLIGINIDNEKKVIDLRHINGVQYYDIEEMKAYLFFNKFYNSNLEMFSDIKNISKDEMIDIPKLRKLLTIFFKNEYPTYKIIQSKYEIVQEIEEILLHILNQDTQEGKEIALMVSVLGRSNIKDILYYYRPEYKNTIIGDTKFNSIIAGYIGKSKNKDTYIRGSSLLDLPKSGLNVLMLPNSKQFEEVLEENIKQDLLIYYNNMKDKDPKISNGSIVEGYFVNKREELIKYDEGEALNKLKDLLKKVENYFDDILTGFEKPDQIVENLKKDERIFPDFYQMINISEIMHKKRMLIADEMGLGKSASAIMSKEYLGEKCKHALIVVPSNLIKTWQVFLSDKVDKHVNQEGYFKKKRAPKVGVIGETDFSELSKCDYVIVSHERLTSHNVKKIICQYSFNMIIVDEIHKLKNNASGVRAKQLLNLSSELEKREDAYLCLLSGTPIPNKIKDVAVILKLLYPEKDFSKQTSNQLTKKLINGDIQDIRNLLFTRMQKKESNLPMPKKLEIKHQIELEGIEKEIYDKIYNDTKINRKVKIQILRKYLLNPNYLIKPNFDSKQNLPQKIQYLKDTLKKSFKTKKRVVVFVNNFIENILKGDNNIIEQMGLEKENGLKKLKIRKIFGDNIKSIDPEKHERAIIQKEFNKIGTEKILLFINGAVGDVGIDLTGGKEIIFFNEPWTLYDKMQQIARVYRAGLAHDIEVHDIIVKGTIEEKMYEYIREKYRIIERVMNGIPLSEMDKKLLAKNTILDDENYGKNDIDTKGSELGDYYIVTSQQMFMEGDTLSYGGYKNENELKASLLLDQFECGYEANTNRIVAGLMEKQIGEQVNDLKIGDFGGYKILKDRLQEKYQSSLLSIYSNNNFDCLNMSLVLQDTALDIKEGNYERVSKLLEANVLLKNDGVLYITLSNTYTFNQTPQFKKLMGYMGFEIVDKHTGQVISHGYECNIFTLKKIGNSKNILDLIQLLQKPVNSNVLALFDTDEQQSDSKDILSEFSINDKKYEINLNQKDKEIYEEQKQIEADLEILKSEYSDIGDITKGRLKELKFFYVLIDGKEYLYRRMESTRGARIRRLTNSKN